MAQKGLQTMYADDRLAPLIKGGLCPEAAKMLRACVSSAQKGDLETAALFFAAALGHRLMDKMADQGTHGEAWPAVPIDEILSELEACIEVMDLPGLPQSIKLLRAFRQGTDGEYVKAAMGRAPFVHGQDTQDA